MGAHCHCSSAAVDIDRPLKSDSFVNCRSGVRSPPVAPFLHSAGYSLYNLDEQYQEDMGRCEHCGAEFIGTHSYCGKCDGPKAMGNSKDITDRRTILTMTFRPSKKVQGSGHSRGSGTNGDDVHGRTFRRSRQMVGMAISIITAIGTQARMLFFAKDLGFIEGRI